MGQESFRGALTASCKAAAAKENMYWIASVRSKGSCHVTINTNDSEQHEEEKWVFIVYSILREGEGGGKGWEGEGKNWVQYLVQYLVFIVCSILREGGGKGWEGEGK